MAGNIVLATKLAFSRRDKQLWCQQDPQQSSPAWYTRGFPKPGEPQREPNNPLGAHNSCHSGR